MIACLAVENFPRQINRDWSLHKADTKLWMQPARFQKQKSLAHPAGSGRASPGLMGWDSKQWLPM